MTVPDPLRELALAASDGDRSALERLLEALYDRIVAVTRRICGPDHDDATQHALIAIARGIVSFDGRSQVSTWSYRIATNAALDELRRRARHGSHESLDVIAALDTTRPFDQLDDRMRIDAALQQLSPDHRAAIVLREIAQLDYEEIALTLGVPIGTVRSRINRARRHLADSLTEGNSIERPDVEAVDP